MSLPEVLLWNMLRGQPLGIKFRREHPTGEYSIDFYCLDAQLAIEVDGESHSMGDRPLHDERRDAWLASKGIETLRIPARDLLTSTNETAEALLAAVRSRLPLHHPASPGGPAPRDKLGEDREG